MVIGIKRKDLFQVEWLRPGVLVLKQHGRPVAEEQFEAFGGKEMNYNALLASLDSPLEYFQNVAGGDIDDAEEIIGEELLNCGPTEVDYMDVDIVVNRTLEVDKELKSLGCRTAPMLFLISSVRQTT